MRRVLGEKVKREKIKKRKYQMESFFHKGEVEDYFTNA